jgi:hypothetical protein
MSIFASRTALQGEIFPTPAHSGILRRLFFLDLEPVMKLLQRDKLSRRARQDAREYSLVFDQRITDDKSQPEAWQGLGQLVSLVDAELAPHGQACLNERNDLDAITLVLDGRIRDAAARPDNDLLITWDVLVKPATPGGCGHTLVNPDETASRLVQLLLWPTLQNNPAGVRVLRPAEGRVTRIRGDGAQADDAASRTCVDIARLQGGQSLDIDKPALVYVCEGRGFADEDTVTTGTLISSDQLTFDATDDTGLLIIHEERA